MNIEYNADELSEMEEQTATIVTNLRVIDKSPPVEELVEQTNTIVTNLHTISEDQTNLDILEEQTSNIVRDLGTISDLEELETQLDRIIAKLDRVKDAGTNLTIS